jgi:hypothetical protein
VERACHVLKASYLWKVFDYGIGKWLPSLWKELGSIHFWTLARNSSLVWRW